MIAPARILVIRRRYMGDVVLLGRLWRSLRRHWPGCHLAGLVGTPYAPVLPMYSDVNHAIAFENGALAWLKSLLALRRERFTHVLDLDNRPRTALISRLLGAEHRIALHHGSRVRLPRCYTEHAIAPDNFFDDHHISDYYLLTLRSLGVTPSEEIPILQPDPTATASIRDLPELAQLAPGQRKICIHPGSRSPHRIWPAERFAAVIDRLREHNLAVILVAGPGEQTVMREIQSRLQQPVPNISRQLTIPQLAALFKIGDALLCHDSGPMHLAAAVGTRVVALFSSQNVATWRPLGDGHITLQAPMPCSPCLSPGFCVPSDSYRNHCVRHLTVEHVFAAVIQQLNAKQARLPPL